MDLPPYAAEEVQIVEERLAECGLNSDGYTVSYQDYLQSVEVVIDDGAGAQPEHFPCIKQAAGAGFAIVSFSNRESMTAYMDWVVEQRRPQMLADSEAELRKLGKWEGLPQRADFETDSLFAMALESHCDQEPGSLLEGRDGWITLKPEAGLGLTHDEFKAKLSCLFSAINYATAYDPSLKFGFIGNGKFRESE